jgi:uncharacterized protein (TIGR02996 family)
MSQPNKPPTTTTTELNLLATIQANPADAVALEVYADYLQEQGPAREADEVRVRAEAQALRDGNGPLTFEQVRKVAATDIWKEGRAWEERQKTLLKRVICAAMPDRAKLIQTEKELRLEVDNELVSVAVHSRPAASDRVTCRISSYRCCSRLILRGKRGFNVHRVIAEVIKQVDTGLTRREADRVSKERSDRLNDAIGKVEVRFGLKPRTLLGQAYSGERLTLKLERSPEEMERIVRLLAENGLLTPGELAAPSAPA